MVNSEQSNAVPATAREFDRWLADHYADPAANAWPPYLDTLAQRALFTLKSMETGAVHQNERFMAESAKDLQAFAQAYAEWKR